MIDLTKKGLPNVITINGKPFSIYTDYRVWMKFEISLVHAKKSDLIDIDYLFKNEKPIYCDVHELMPFARPHNELPRNIGKSSDAIPIDFELDSDLIYSAFLGQYGIDLVEVEELHWHKFLALLRGLNDSTLMHQVMQYRLYEKQTRKDVDPYEILRDMWEIERVTEEEQAEIDEVNALFK